MFDKHVDDPIELKNSKIVSMQDEIYFKSRMMYNVSIQNNCYTNFF